MRSSPSCTSARYPRRADVRADAARVVDTVVLVHGLWMRGFTLLPLARRLEAAGYRVRRVDYPSVTRSPDCGTGKLVEALTAPRDGLVHVVGHSLGGVLALETLRRHDIDVGRVVCLGSPLRGSAAAAGLRRWPGGRHLVGRCGCLLCAGTPAWTKRIPVGVIAGTMPIGFGFAIARFDGPHDGTVSLAETRLDGIADHVCVRTTHTGLLFSAQVARQTLAFLRDGRFARADQPPA